MPHPRRSLPVTQWPAADHAAWTAALTETDPLDDPGLAAHWQLKTKRTVTTQYGLWLAWLLDGGLLDPTTMPATRVTRAYLAGYLHDLRARRLSSSTTASRFRNLREALRVMQPSANLSTLNHVLARLEAVAEPSRDKRTRVVSPALLLDVAIVEMARQQRSHDRKPSRRAAERFRDALLVAFLATRPVRLANLAAIKLDEHLTKHDKVYWCRFTGHETKDREPLEFPMPTVLTPWLDFYAETLRPMLLRNNKSCGFWITIRSTPMAENTIYCRVTRLTKQLVGKPINPHLFRSCIATLIAEQAPEQIRIVARILGHSTLRSSDSSYNQAGMLSAHKRYQRALATARHDPGP